VVNPGRPPRPCRPKRFGPADLRLAAPVTQPVTVSERKKYPLPPLLTAKKRKEKKTTGTHTSPRPPLSVSPATADRLFYFLALFEKFLSNTPLTVCFQNLDPQLGANAIGANAIGVKVSVLR
jgi:hypothetical protein